MQNKGIGTIMLIIVLFVFGYWLFNTSKGAVVRGSVSNFIECEQYGYTVSEGFPRRCYTPRGQIFAESTLTTNSYGAAVYPAYSRNQAQAYVTYPIAKSSSSSSYSAPRNYYSTSSSYYIEPNPGYSYYTTSNAPVYLGPPSIDSGGCFVSGCSGQICSDQPSAMSTCEYRKEYSCYQHSACERQPSGQCGWTPNEQLFACFNNFN
ncbi:MAG: hypothetical protein WAV15_00185 [Minisyncoccia bacterium]